MKVRTARASKEEFPGAWHSDYAGFCLINSSRNMEIEIVSLHFFPTPFPS